MKDCEFLKIEKADYDRILRPIMDRKYSARVTLLRGLPVFGDLPLEDLKVRTGFLHVAILPLEVST